MGVIRTWLWNRAREVTTWVGLGLVSFGNLGLSSTNPNVQQGLQIANQWGPQVGAFLVAISSKHP